MKKFISIILMLTMILTLSACGNKKEPADTTAAESGTADTTFAKIENTYKFLNDGVLTIGAEMTYAPFEMKAEDGTTPIGYDVDFAKALGEKLGVEVKFVDTAWDGLFEGIGVNYDAVISAVTVNPERQKTMLFSDSYIDNYQTIVIRKDSDLKFNSLTDLNGHSVAFQKETTSDDCIKDLMSTNSIECTRVECEKIIACFSQLTNGEVDVVLCDSSVAKAYVSKDPGKYKVAFTDNENPEQFAVAVKLGNTELQGLINDAMAQLKEEKFFDELNNYWFAGEGSQK